MNRYLQIGLAFGIIALVFIAGIYIMWPDRIENVDTDIVNDDESAVDIFTFQDCVDASGAIVESLPRLCRYNGKTFFENENDIPPADPGVTTYFTCLDIDAAEDAFCITQYAPVCASVNVECITTPCNPVLETFSNSCEACRTGRINYYSEGACL